MSMETSISRATNIIFIENFNSPSSPSFYIAKDHIFIQDEEENRDPRIVDLVPILQPNLILFLEFVLPNSFLGSRDHSNIYSW